MVLATYGEKAIAHASFRGNPGLVIKLTKTDSDVFEFHRKELLCDKMLVVLLLYRVLLLRVNKGNILESLIQSKFLQGSCFRGC